ncbi:MAG: glycosyltransferase, partial [Agathobacter sp.]
GVGINLNRFRALSEGERREVRQSLHLQETDIFAIVVGRLDREKNHGVLIEAAARIKDPRFHLFICGDGPLEAELTKQIAALGMENQVHLMGFRSDIEKLCGAADLYLFASVREGLPVATAEAMACGLPIVASRIRGNSDLIDEGLGGYLVEPTDADGFVEGAKRILRDEHLRLAMREYNLSKVREYGIETVTAQMAELYQSVDKGK